MIQNIVCRKYFFVKMNIARGHASLVNISERLCNLYVFSVILLESDSYSRRCCQFPMEHFVEILAFTVLNHGKVLEVEPAFLELKYCISLSIIVILQCLLLLIKEPLYNRRLIFTKAFNLVRCIVRHIVAELLRKHFLLSNSIYRQQIRGQWVAGTANVLHLRDDLLDAFDVWVFLSLVSRFF